MSKTIVVDTNIYQGASPPYEQGTYINSPNHCRQILEAILEICHKVVFNDLSVTEWNNHVASKFTNLWLGNMRRRGKVVALSSEYNRFSTLLVSNRDKIEQVRYPHIEKDAFLFDLALATDKIIISQEKRMVKHIIANPDLFAEQLTEINYALLTADPAEHTVLIDWLHNHCKTPDYLMF